MSNQTLEHLSRAQLAHLGREFMLVAQFNSRTGYAALAMNHGQDAYKETAIDNWMAASPVYTKRMQKAMKLKEGSDVAAILKALQLDCGLSHQYFDAHFELESDNEGYFWLQSCGPLLETEPRGPDAVKVMCHDIEDPTFDASAAAANPYARVRPIHRPPRVPASRAPVCRWRVFIDNDAEPLPEPEVAVPVYETKLANTLINSPVASSPGLQDYSGPVLEQLELERFSHSALVVICKELAVQIHLLIHGLGQAVSMRYGENAVDDIAEFQMCGTAWVASERLAEWLGCTGGGIDAIVEVLKVHPAFQPDEYVSCAIDTLNEQQASIEFFDCDAANEQGVFSWYRLLEDDRTQGLEALVQGVDAKARISRPDETRMYWEITVADANDAVEPPLAVQVAMGTQLYNTRLRNHIELLDVTP